MQNNHKSNAESPYYMPMVYRNRLFGKNAKGSYHSCR